MCSDLGFWGKRQPSQLPVQTPQSPKSVSLYEKSVTGVLRRPSKTLDISTILGLTHQPHEGGVCAGLCAELTADPHMGVLRVLEASVGA